MLNIAIKWLFSIKKVKLLYFGDNLYYNEYKNKKFLAGAGFEPAILDSVTVNITGMEYVDINK